MATDLVEDRSDETYLLQVQDITLTPEVPEPGKPLRWDLTARLAEQVDLAEVECQVQVKLGLITLLRRTYMLPELLKAYGAELSGDLHPPAGEWKQTWTMNLPKEIPRGDFRVYVQSFTGGGEEKDFCDLFLHVDFRR
ncbi:ML domain-containing protein [Actinoalloteichus fjordicus]|uniref:Uncharacterized protein n=1 Tax=Actinoalloteichus fjordicus TaxID=1612552 RepID=A0AAC9L816_9PSEU|nr:hypothetical protein [Actinoalloteichus fjordicus]APU13098.1 hypothetical protein UA74_05110 [Actinoalloteichus fjordicus]